MHWHGGLYSGIVVKAPSQVRLLLCPHGYTLRLLTVCLHACPLLRFTPVYTTRPVFIVYMIFPEEYDFYYGRALCPFTAFQWSGKSTNFSEQNKLSHI